MAWEQDISQLVESLEEAAVRFDIAQGLTGAEKATARDNIGFETTVTLIEDNDHRINCL